MKRRPLPVRTDARNKKKNNSRNIWKTLEVQTIPSVPQKVSRSETMEADVRVNNLECPL